MAYRKRRPIVPPVNPDVAADEIAEAYFTAKVANPKLTQREFARKAMPTISTRYDNAKSKAEKKRIEESGARYLRLVLEGKRTGRVNVERAQQFRAGSGPDLFQVMVRDSKGVMRSFDLSAVGGRSQLDVPLIEQQLRDNPRAIENRIFAWRERYDIEIEIEDIADFEVRRVLVHRKHSERIVLRSGDVPVNMP
jgi:hypothetical protein